MCLTGVSGSCCFSVTIVFSNYHYLLCELLQRMQCAQAASREQREDNGKGVYSSCKWRVLLLLFRVESLHWKDIAQDATLSRSALAAVDRRVRSSQCSAGGYIKGK
jgi:hypothetical protein